MNGVFEGLLGGLGSLGIGNAGWQNMSPAQAQFQASWLANMANAQAQYIRQQSPEEIAHEIARKDCALAMKNDLRTKRFMEKALPLDWCHRLYPEAYEVTQ